MTTEQKTTFDVEGMTCPSCARHINTALTGVAGVREVQVKIREGQVLVRHDTTTATTEAIIEALGEAGFIGRVTKS